MTLSLHQYRRPLLALLAGLLSFAAAQQPGDACGGAADCGNLNFCQFATGACGVTTGTTGTCAMVPDMCPMDINPVCGCDGRTYDNACKAHSNQVSVASEGDCAAAAVAVSIADASCTAGDAAACDKGSFCQVAAGGCGGAGTCAVVPETCIFLMDPVCGCDGEDYSNECAAHSAGANVASSGYCGTAAVGIAAADGSCTDDAACDKGDYCNFATGACGGAGKCDERPEVCTKEYAPVCGCDDETHDNECVARRAGASVASAGACRSAGLEGAPEMAGGAPETAEGAPETAEGADPEPAETTDTADPDPDPDSMLSSGGTSAVQPSALGVGAVLVFALGFVQ